MSRENVDYVRRRTEAWNAGDLEFLVSRLPSDAEWAVAAEHPDARTLRGPEEIGAYLRDWASTMPGLQYSATEYLDADDAVVTLGSVSGVAGERGPEVTVALAFVTRFVDGVPVRTEEYLDPADALAAAGL